MDSERRRNEKALSLELKRYLNEAQKDQLRNLEQFGWTLKIVRHPPFQEPLAFVFDPDHGTYVLLDKDGGLKEDHGIVIR